MNLIFTFRNIIHQTDQVTFHYLHISSNQMNQIQISGTSAEIIFP